MLFATEVKKIFKAGTKQIHYKNIVVSLNSKPSYIRYPNCVQQISECKSKLR